MTSMRKAGKTGRVQVCFEVAGCLCGMSCCLVRDWPEARQGSRERRDGNQLRAVPRQTITPLDSNGAMRKPHRSRRQHQIHDAEADLTSGSGFQRRIRIWRMAKFRGASQRLPGTVRMRRATRDGIASGTGIRFWAAVCASREQLRQHPLVGGDGFPALGDLRPACASQQKPRFLHGVMEFRLAFLEVYLVDGTGIEPVAPAV